MIVDAMIVPVDISSTDGYVCGAGKILEEPSFTDFLFKTWYNRNLKLGRIYKIKLLWPLTVLLPLLCQISYLDLGNFLPKNARILAVHICQTI